MGTNQEAAQAVMTNQEVAQQVLWLPGLSGQRARWGGAGEAGLSSSALPEAVGRQHRKMLTAAYLLFITNYAQRLLLYQ